MSAPRTWALHGNIVPGREHYEPEDLGSFDEIKVVELEPLLDLLENARPTDGRAWPLASGALVAAVEALLREHGRP